MASIIRQLKKKQEKSSTTKSKTEGELQGIIGPIYYTFPAQPKNKGTQSLKPTTTTMRNKKRKERRTPQEEEEQFPD